MHEPSGQSARTQGRALPFSFVSLILTFSLAATDLLAFPSPESSQPIETAALIPAGSALSHAFIHMAQQAKTSVVNITVKRKITGDPGQQKRPPWLDIQFSRRFYEQSSIPEEEMSMPDSREQDITSGVIFRSDGYILTNHHVVDQAYDIRVQLIDERVFQAELIGQDRATDVAVLKINASQLPAFRWGNSDLLKVGEIVMAVGNPFGLSQTLTMGIISTAGRANIGFVDYESFIQTDAAINPGNFGGALINLNSELIGINTAILHESSETIGIGFAIPSQMAKAVATSLINQGKVTRGWAGIATQKLTPGLAEHFKTSIVHGVVITDVAKGGLAGRAKLQRRDIILKYKGTPITNPRQLQSLIAETIPGTSITIQRLKGGQEKDITVKIEEFPLKRSPHSPLKPKDSAQLLTGVTVEPVPKNFPGKEGILVREIAPGSLVDKRGLEEGDIILEIDQKPIRSVKDFERLAEELGLHDKALLLLRRENATMFLPIHKGN
jgi:serine protease Do